MTLNTTGLTSAYVKSGGFTVRLTDSSVTVSGTTYINGKERQICETFTHDALIKAACGGVA